MRFKIFSLVYVLLMVLVPGQKIKMLKEGDSDFIDYESDKKWLAKMETYVLSDVEISKQRVNVKENFAYANAISDIHIDYNEVMEEYIRKYTSYRWLPKTFGLLKFYEPLFEAKLREYGLPADLKYLPIVESNLNPVAGSWVGASGLWQFMPATGREYGLAKTDYVNLFFDPYMSTDSACRYLRKLYKLFGDWNLVLSAYNSGEGRVLGAMRKAGSKNYWEVRRFLPAETKAYAPSFHAVRFISKMYGLYYSSLPKMKYDFTKVRESKVARDTTFEAFANLNGLNIDKLYFLNPHIVTEFIPKGTFIYFVK